MSSIDKLPRPFFILAPMDDVTDTVFRQIVDGCAAPDLFFTEFVNVDGLQSPGRPKLLNKLRFTDKERPIVAQIWGKEPENFYKTARQIADGSLVQEIQYLRTKNGDAEQGKTEQHSKAYKELRRTSSAGFDTALRPKLELRASFAGLDGQAVLSFAGVDLNFGCPERKVIKNGLCIGMINNPQLAGEIIQATTEGLNGTLPLSVKTRLGLQQQDFTWHEFLLKYKLNMLTIHGRTAKEMSKVSAHWDAIEHVRQLRDQLSPTTLIVGNGDVGSRAEGEILAKRHGLDGIMIGRGIFQDPYAFATKSPWANMTKHQKLNLYTKHVKLWSNTWQDQGPPLQTLNKFCKIYINGFDGAKELREQLMAAKSTDDLLALLSSF